MSKMDPRVITQIVSTPDDQFITTVLMPQDVFDAVCDELARMRPVNLACNRPIGPDLLSKIRRMGCLPMIQRSPRTQAIFERFGILTHQMCGMLQIYAAEAYEID